MDTYQSYNPSGVEWIKEIPTQWDLIKIKELFIERNEKNSELLTDFLSVTKDRGVIPYSEKGNVGNKTSDDIVKYKKVYEDDLVINPMNIIIGSVGLSKHFGVLSNVYIVLTCKPNFIPKFGSYIFSNSTFQKYLKRICYGIMELRESLNKIEFFVEKLPVPSLLEQQQIVQFLDEKTQLIDKLISLKEKKISLLREQRTSIINQIVTKGLNPSVKMKFSGVDWIGEIPEHWEVYQIRRFTIEHRQGYYSTEGYTQDGYRVVRITDLKEYNKIDVSESPFYQPSEEDIQRYKLIRGDFLFQRTGSHKKIGIFESEEPSIYGSFLIRFRFSKTINHRFLLYFFNSTSYSNQLFQQIHGGVNPNIHVENIKVCYITIPSISEQSRIVEYLDKQTNIIDSTIKIEEKKIELLNEYRQSLISEVVTGKVKVTTDE